MRFLMLNWRDPKNPKAGGAERVTEAYLKALRSRGHEVFWFANAFEGCVDQEEVSGICVVRGGGQGTSVLKAREWFRAQARFDLVIDQHHGIPWYAPWWCGTNCVAYIHEVLGPIWGAFYGWPLNWIGRAQERATHWAYRKIPFWVPSESTRAALLKNGVHFVRVIPNGSDTVPLPRLDEKRLSQPVRLIAVSRLAPNKRVVHALHATKLLMKMGCEAHLTVVGSGEELEPLKAAARELRIADRTTFTGGVSETQKNAALQAAHLLVHASIREGWGLNVIEANAMGTPAVVYPVGGLVDSTVDGVTGVITITETPEAIAKAVLALVRNPEKYTALREAAWERSKTFAWSHVLPLACDWLESCARQSKIVRDGEKRY